MCTGWIEVGGKHYYLYEDGHCAMNEITPDGFRVDADGAWYEAKRELLGQEFPLPAGFQNSISLGDGWGGAQAALNGAAGKISADSGGKRKLLIDSTAIEYKSAVKSAKDDASTWAFIRIVQPEATDWISLFYWTETARHSPLERRWIMKSLRPC